MIFFFREKEELHVCIAVVPLANHTVPAKQATLWTEPGCSTARRVGVNGTPLGKELDDK